MLDRPAQLIDHAPPKGGSVVSEAAGCQAECQHTRRHGGAHGRFYALKVDQNWVQ